MDYIYVFMVLIIVYGLFVIFLFDYVLIISYYWIDGIIWNGMNSWILMNSLLCSSILLLYFFIMIVLCVIIILMESFSVPFDLPEAESELVAGYITEYSAILFSLILLTEYTNIIFMVMIFNIMLNITYIMCFSVWILIFIAIIRSAFNRILYDEMMSICWTMFILLVFISLLLLVFGV